MIFSSRQKIKAHHFYIQIICAQPNISSLSLYISENAILQDSEENFQEWSDMFNRMQEYNAFKKHEQNSMHNEKIKYMIKREMNAIWKNLKEGKKHTRRIRVYIRGSKNVDFFKNYRTWGTDMRSTHRI